VIQVTALLSGHPTSDVSALAERLKSAAAATDGPELVVRGLVVSTVLKYLTGPNDVRALLQVWVDGSADGSADGGEVLNLVLPGEAWSDGPVDAWVVREHVYKQPVERQAAGASPDGVKLAGTAYRRDDFTPEAFFDYWRDVHSRISGKVPGLGGYVVSEVCEPVRGESAPDALLELWWPDERTYEASASTPEQAAAWDDVPRYAKTTGTFWLLRETVLIPPPPTGPGTLEATG
jgi:uncharacterized protein (TIGR02118 family)